MHTVRDNEMYPKKPAGRAAIARRRSESPDVVEKDTGANNYVQVSKEHLSGSSVQS